jgi:two-component system NtrC family sensor kinase
MSKGELILLALDPSPTLQLMERALRATGYEIAIAQDHESLRTSLQESTPALVIIGEKFAGEGGIPLAVDMLDRFPTLPILLYIEKETTGIIKATLTAGLSGYLCPPLKTDTIVDTVQKAIGRARHLGDWIRREVKRTTSSLAERAKISEAERAKLRAIFAGIQDGVIVMDDKRNIVFVNQAVCNIFKVDEKEITGQPVDEAIPHPELKSLLTRSLASPLKYHEINLDDGQVFNAQFTPIPNIGSAITLQDISYLKEVERMKSDFVHTVSHDLRSPLTSVLGYTELLERVGPLNAQQQEFLEKLKASIQHITTLVNDLLDLGRLEAGFDTRRERVQLESILTYTLDNFDGQLKKKNINLALEIENDLPPLRANPIRIRQMLDNLIGNAIKYSPEDTTITISIRQTEERQIILMVKDMGPGIPPAEQARIFEKFYRATNVPVKITGSGLGLAIVKSIVESHQGRVWVESSVGQGSSFFVVLPAFDEN